MSLTSPIMIRRVQGHSMVPILPPGTVVYAWRWYRAVRPNKVVIFTRENREVIKRVDHVNDDQMFVLGDHPETSTDSRHYGNISVENVLAIVVWPRTAKVLAENDPSAKKRRRFTRRQKDS